jgi:hypothetical protein
MAFSLDDVIGKIADAFDKSAEEHYQKAEQAEALSDLVTDPDLREQFEDILEQGAIFGFTLLNRLKDIFPQDEEEDETPEPEPKPEPEEEEDPFTAQLREILSRIGSVPNPQGYSARSGFFPTDPKTGGYPFPF